jgi:two-component system chemotaxis response regulator CheY
LQTPTFNVALTGLKQLIGPAVSTTRLAFAFRIEHDATGFSRMADQKRCLIVDDSGVIRKIARIILEDLRFTVDEAENGQEALERCKAAMPELILLDWHMPVMGALDFLTALRATHRTRRPFVIYCTTEHDVADITRAFQHGADDYIIKPFDREVLENKLNEINTVAALA